jgi:hypothetical protein
MAEYPLALRSPRRGSTCFRSSVVTRRQGRGIDANAFIDPRHWFWSRLQGVIIAGSRARSAFGGGVTAASTLRPRPLHRRYLCIVPRLLDVFLSAARCGADLARTSCWGCGGVSMGETDA